MNTTGSKGNSAEMARKAQREERLAAELRANLKRRKAAARARVEPPETGGDAAPGAGADEVQPNANKDTA
ncbi:MAG: hypothetical protein WBP38_14165 [Hyphomicrobium sp.]|jgi:hypothetical protein|nr:hypothetical protein [Hyphomicrobium sp.]